MRHPVALAASLASLLALATAPLRAAESDPIREALEAYDSAVSQASNTWRRAVSRLLEAGLTTAEDDLAAAKIAGNTSRQARAIATRNAFQKALDGLETGTPEFPDNIRRDIRPLIEKAQSELTPLAQTRDSALDHATATLHAAVRKIHPNATETTIPELLRKARAQAPTPAIDTATASSPNASPAATPATASPYDSNGEATTWAPLLGVAVEVADVEIVTLPVLQVRTRQTLTLSGALGDVPAAITPLKNVLSSSPGTAPLAFRASNVPGFPAPDILEWPSPKNMWCLQLRCRPDGDKPNALTLEIDARAPGLTTLDGATATISNSQRIPVSIDTRPSGASVLVDGRQLLTPAGSPLVTPCEILLPPEGAALELRLSGYLPKSSPCVKPPANHQPVTIPLAPDPDFIDKTISIRASSASAMTGINLKQGRKYRVRVEGTWSCDAAKTLTSCEGYPLDKYPEFYADPATYPRLTTNASFGALLFSIGKSPTWKALPPSATLTADASGPLRLDLNEGGGPRNRTNNTGSLTLHIRSL